MYLVHPTQIMYELPVRNLLGKTFSGNEWISFTNKLTSIYNEHVTGYEFNLDEKKFKDALYIRARPFGLECCFDQPASTILDHHQWKLGAIHIFHNNDGFSECPFILPHQLTPQLVAKDIIRLLGQPDKKCGGHHTPITMTYTKLTPNVEIEFAYGDWKHAENPIKSITFFLNT